jgi:enhancing lycopene biosynthesis protein 2
MKPVGVLLSGCGVFDGSEVHEATLTLYYLDRLGVPRICIAPNAPQTQVINHATGEAQADKRNMLTEAARIARGPVTALDELKADDISALILVGGFGAAKNLSDYAVKGRDLTVRPDVTKILLAMKEANKPIGSLCIASVLLAKVFGDNGLAVEVTIGSDVEVAKDIGSFGAVHTIKLVDEVLVDSPNRIVTTPAYMEAKNVAEIGPGIRRAVELIVDMAN